MRIVLDTNTVISGLLWAGPPRQIIALVEQEYIVHCTSPDLVEEFGDVISRPKLAARLQQVQISAEELLERYLRFSAVVIKPDQVPAVIDRDPDDDHVLACALAASAAYIISGDRHLLDLKNYRGIPILNAADFLALYRAAAPPE